MEENESQEPSFGEIMDLVKQYEEAEKLKRPIYLDEEHYEQIIQFYQENRAPQKALRVIEEALNQYSFSGYFYIKQAEILANDKKFDEALLALDEAQKLDPTDINIFLIRADVYLWQGKHTQAIAEAEFALTQANDPVDKCELYLEMADILEDQQKYPEVVEILKTAVRLDPMNEEALNRFWFCVELTQDYEGSITFHEEIIEQSPYAYLAWFNLGHAHAGLQQYEKALEAFEYVMAIDEKYDGAYICCGDVKFNMEQYQDALQYYMDAIKMSKPQKELYLKTAETYEMLNELSKARAYLRKAIAVDPYYDEAFFRIGETYREEEKWQKAISSFERAVKLNKENPEFLAALADAYLSVDEGEKAVDIFERLFQLDTQDKQNWINLATAYFNVEDYRKAFQVLHEAEQKFENSADIFYIKSVFYFQAGNKHEAILNLERGLLTNFDEHTIIFDMDDSLLDNETVLSVIEQYRS